MRFVETSTTTLQIKALVATRSSLACVVFSVLIELCRKRCGPPALVIGCDQTLQRDIVAERVTYDADRGVYWWLGSVPELLYEIDSIVQLNTLRRHLQSLRTSGLLAIRVEPLGWWPRRTYFGISKSYVD